LKILLKVKPIIIANIAVEIGLFSYPKIAIEIKLFIPSEKEYNINARIIPGIKFIGNFNFNLEYFRRFYIVWSLQILYDLRLLRMLIYR